jgi:6-phosphofructokinase 1
MKSRFNIKKLGSCKIPSPLKLSKVAGDDIFDYIVDSDRVLYDQSLDSFKKHMDEGKEPLSFEKAGPREFLCFDPKKTKAGIVTCGGLCPGLNDVIRSLVMVLHYRYGVRDILVLGMAMQEW